MLWRCPHVSSAHPTAAASIAHSNNLPLDLFGLYREVVARGGMLDNERYDERGRWVGGINFAGEVFPRIRNYTPNNRSVD